MRGWAFAIEQEQVDGNAKIELIAVLLDLGRGNAHDKFFGWHMHVQPLKSGASTFLAVSQRFRDVANHLQTRKPPDKL